MTDLPAEVRARSVLAITGSLRRGSYNRLLVQAAAECAPAGLAIHVGEDLASISLFDEDLETATGEGPEAVRRLRGQVGAADGLLIATPEYNHSLPGVLKNAIDWLSRPAPEEVLSGKPVALMGASAGRGGTRLAQAALRQVLYATESLVLAKPAIFLADASRLFDAEGSLIDVRSRRQLADMLVAFDRWIELVGQERGRPAPFPRLGAS